MKLLLLQILFLFSFLLLVNSCQDQNLTEPVNNKSLSKLTHNHIGPCVYCYEDTLGYPVSNADVTIYQGLTKIAYLGKTDGTGWVHTIDDLLNEGWYNAIAQKSPLFGVKPFYFNPDTTNFVYVKMIEQ